MLADVLDQLIAAAPLGGAGGGLLLWLCWRKDRFGGR